MLINPEQLSKSMDLAVSRRNAKQAPRSYIGASGIGHPCEVNLAMCLRGYSDDEFPSNVLRIFDLGHILEDYIFEQIEMAFKAPEMAAKYKKVIVTAHDPYRAPPVQGSTASQWRVSGYGGIVAGHLDGILFCQRHDGVVEVVTLEIKTMNYQWFKTCALDGVYFSHSKYYMQMQCGLGLMKLCEHNIKNPRRFIKQNFESVTGVTYGEQSLFVAMNKNNSRMHIEVIEYDSLYFNYLLHRVDQVLTGRVERIAHSPFHHECKFCSKSSQCWIDDLAVFRPVWTQQISAQARCNRCQHLRYIALPDQSKPFSMMCKLTSYEVKDPVNESCGDFYNFEPMEKQVNA